MQTSLRHQFYINRSVRMTELPPPGDKTPVTKPSCNKPPQGGAGLLRSCFVAGGLSVVRGCVSTPLLTHTQVLHQPLVGNDLLPPATRTKQPCNKNHCSGWFLLQGCFVVGASVAKVFVPSSFDIFTASPLNALASC